jgi:hypothetical protein
LVAPFVVIAFGAPVDARLARLEAWPRERIA